MGKITILFSGIEFNKISKDQNAYTKFKKYNYKS